MSFCELRGVGRVFDGPQEVVALKGVDLQIERGEFVAFMGPSGSGKSTLLNILGLLDRPSSGEYRLENADMWQLNERARARMRAELIGFVFQEFHLMAHLPAIDNVALGASFQGISRKDSFELALEEMEGLAIAHRATASPRTLSGGERQRVAVARALVGQKSLLLCDEPTGNLDIANTETLLALLRDRANDGTTVLVVTHDPEVARQADRVCSIKDGRVFQ